MDTLKTYFQNSRLFVNGHVYNFVTMAERTVSGTWSVFQCNDETYHFWINEEISEAALGLLANQATRNPAWIVGSPLFIPSPDRPESDLELVIGWLNSELTQTRWRSIVDELTGHISLVDNHVDTIDASMTVQSQTIDPGAVLFTSISYAYGTSIAVQPEGLTRIATGYATLMPGPVRNLLSTLVYEADPPARGWRQQSLFSNLDLSRPSQPVRDNAELIIRSTTLDSFKLWVDMDEEDEYLAVGFGPSIDLIPEFISLITNVPTASITYQAPPDRNLYEVLPQAAYPKYIGRIDQIARRLSDHEKSRRAILTGLKNIRGLRNLVGTRLRSRKGEQMPERFRRFMSSFKFAINTDKVNKHSEIE